MPVKVFSNEEESEECRLNHIYMGPMVIRSTQFTLESW